MLDTIIQNSPLLYLTQSLWRDEVFSIFVAQRPIAAFIGNLSFEPPLYYIILHFWMKIFGSSEIATRSLSFVAFMLANILVIFHAERRFGKHWLSWYTPVFFFLNPMLLYYAFEVRTYGFYILFATASIITYLEKKWGLYLASITLGFYNHAYMVIVPGVIFLHYLLINRSKFRTFTIKKYVNDPMIRNIVFYILLISPWLWIILGEATKLKQSWYFPVDFQLVRSVLGNMFVGYEGTPWYGWKWTAFLSLILLYLFSLAYLDRKNRKTTLLFLLMVFVPLTGVIGISFIKPLFVNRYLIPVTIAEIFLIAGALQNIHNHSRQKIAAGVVLLFVITVNIWYPRQHPKTPSREAIYEINRLWDEDDIVLAASPLVLFEAQYYSSDPSRVYLYNPSGSPFPWYVGDFIVDEKQVAVKLPEYPTRAFILRDDARFEIKYRFYRTDSKEINLN